MQIFFFLLTIYFVVGCLCTVLVERRKPTEPIGHLITFFVVMLLWPVILYHSVKVPK